MAREPLRRAWSPDRVPAIARRAGVPVLTERHWRVITTYREETARRGQALSLESLAHSTGVLIGELQQLFPGDVARLVARLAGVSRAPSVTREPRRRTSARRTHS